MTISSCQFVYCVAMPGTGKTFTGDYLDAVHGFCHVDGDLPYRTAEDPKMRDACKQFFKMNHAFPFLKGTRSSDEQAAACDKHGVDVARIDECWQPFYQVMVDNALEAAKTNNKVVITYASPFQKPRDYVLNKLKEGGARNVTLVFLTMNEDKKLEGLYHRTKKEAKISGMAHGKFLDGFGENPWAGGSDPSLEEFMVVARKPGQLGDVPFEGPPPYANVVDVTGRDASAIDGVDAALGLQRSGKESYDEIAKKVVAMDHKRNEEMPYNCVDIFAEINKEFGESLKNAKTDEEKNLIKRRASSLLKMELATGRLSIASAASSNSSPNK